MGQQDRVTGILKMWAGRPENKAKLGRSQVQRAAERSAPTGRSCWPWGEQLHTD